MSAKKHAWTEPGPVEPDVYATAETRKGTAAAKPVLSLSPTPPAPARRGGSDSTARRAASANGTAPAPPDNRSPAEIEADITRTRNRLAGTLDELSERLTPRALLRRANAKARGVFVSRDGTVRKDRVAMAAGAMTSVVGGAVALRKLKPTRS